MAQTLAPSDVTNTSATLHGTVDADKRPTTYWFDIGPTTAYGAHTQAATTDKPIPSRCRAACRGWPRAPSTTCAWSRSTPTAFRSAPI